MPKYVHKIVRTRLFITVLFKSSLKVKMTWVSINKGLEFSAPTQNDGTDLYIKEGQVVLFTELKRK